MGSIESPALALPNKFDRDIEIRQQLLCQSVDLVGRQIQAHLFDGSALSAVAIRSVMPCESLNLRTKFRDFVLDACRVSVKR